MDNDMECNSMDVRKKMIQLDSLIFCMVLLSRMKSLVSITNIKNGKTRPRCNATKKKYAIPIKTASIFSESKKLNAMKSSDAIPIIDTIILSIFFMQQI